MLLQLTIPKPPFNLPIHDHYHVEFSSSSSLSLKFPSGLCSSSILVPIKAHKNPVFTCYTSRDRSNGRSIDYENKRTMKWKDLYRRLASKEEPKKGVADVLNQWGNDGNWVAKSELSRIVKEFRKFKLYKLALEVYEWMNNRGESISITSSDSAIQLDLIAKVRGISSAEEYFVKLPDSLKDKRVYGALLNVYARARLREKSESLMDVIKSRGFASNALPFNVIMTLYMNLKELNKVESIISEMREKNIPLDIYSYNIWLSSCGSQASAEKMEEVVEQMKQDTAVNPNWTTFSTLATLYINFGHLERAEEYLKKVEGMITGRDRMAYHYLISIYGNIGKKRDVYRVWNLYKSLFLTIPNFGYCTLISCLVRIGDIEGAEKMYNEWLSVKTMYDPRIGNLLLDWYVREGFSEKALIFYDRMIKIGGKANSRTWEILAERHIRERRISEAINCLKNAVSADGSIKWRPKQATLSSILKLCEEEGDMGNKETLSDVLRQITCLEDKNYISDNPIKDGVYSRGEPSLVTDTAQDDADDGETGVLLNQLQGSL